MLLANLHEVGAVLAYARVDVIAVNRINAQRKDFCSILLAASCRRCEYRHVHVFQFGYVLNDVILRQFGGLVLGTVAPYDTRNLEVFSGFERLNGELTDVAVAYYGRSNLLHILTNV